MNFDWLSQLVFRLRLGKLYLKRFGYQILKIAYTYPPFKYFFHTLAYFEINERYKKIFKQQQQLTPGLKKGLYLELWEQAVLEYHADVVIQANQTIQQAAKMQLLAQQISLKMDQFLEFLVHNVEYEEARENLFLMNALTDYEDLKGRINACAILWSLLFQGINQMARK